MSLWKNSTDGFSTPHSSENGDEVGRQVEFPDERAAASRLVSGDAHEVAGGTKLREGAANVGIEIAGVEVLAKGQRRGVAVVRWLGRSRDGTAGLRHVRLHDYADPRVMPTLAADWLVCLGS